MAFQKTLRRPEVSATVTFTECTGGSKSTPFTWKSLLGHVHHVVKMAPNLFQIVYGGITGASTVVQLNLKHIRIHKNADSAAFWRPIESIENQS